MLKILVWGWLSWSLLFFPIANLRVEYYDGANIILTQRGIKTKIHLACIAVPPIETQAGQRARQALQRLLEGQPFQYRAIAKDRYGRLLAEIRVGKLNVNRQLVLEGHATYYNPYSTGCEEVAAAARERLPPGGEELRN